MSTLLGANHVGDAFFSTTLKNMLSPNLCAIDSFELVACFLALTHTFSLVLIESSFASANESQWTGLIALLV